LGDRAFSVAASDCVFTRHPLSKAGVILAQIELVRQTIILLLQHCTYIHLHVPHR